MASGQHIAKLRGGKPATLSGIHQTRMKARQSSWAAEDAEFAHMAAAEAGPQAANALMPLTGRLHEPRDMRTLSARFDSALTTDDNRLHWAMADGLAADAAANPAIRYVIRNRARYEVANNCYAAGVGLTIANEFVGTGPRLHLATDDDAVNADLEAKFFDWCRAINLPQKLRTMRMARRQDGEAFALLITNPGLDHPVKLDLRLIEADQVRFVDIALLLQPSVDGIRFDDFGNPVSYHVLRVHPGYWSYATGYIGLPWEYDVWPARYVLHWFRATRPGQHRGIPEILPALPLYATLRRYTQATLDAAESAADYAVLLKTQAGAMFDDEVPKDSLAPFDTIQTYRRMMVALPQGYDAEQLRPEHPTQAYAEFKREVCGEIGRCENVSRNVVLLDSSDSSYSSGQLDHRITYRGYEIDRADAGITLLDRIWRAWLQEAALVEPSKGKWYLPQQLRQVGAAVPHEWYWDSLELGDPNKLANSKETLLSMGLTSQPEEYAKKGQNWERELQRAARFYGIPVEALQARIRDKVFALRAGGPAAAPGPDDEEPVPTAKPAKGKP